MQEEHFWMNTKSGYMRNNVLCSYIRNDYAELSSYCKETGEPVYITKNGEGDVVVMSMDSYEQMQQRIKHLEAKIYFMEKFREANAYRVRSNPNAVRKLKEKIRIERFLDEKQDFYNYM